MSKINTISIRAAIAFTIWFMLPSVSMATHIVGGDMTYRCLGNDQYEITLTIRRDCENGAEDAPFDDPAIIGVFDIFGSLQTHLGNLGRYEIPFMGEDTITNSLVFDCSALGTPVCVHEAIYRDTFFLPFNKIGYRLAYQRCCRNSILVNIEEPLETGATYHVALPVNVLTECNSQPVFKNWPDVYICVNEPLSFDHGAVDPDGDQLIYKLCTPAQGATRENPRPFTPSNPPYPTVVWSGPFSVNNMIGGNPPLSINPNTGLLTGFPDQVGTYLVGICVEEYRNGELLSTVRRDFEYNVRVCGEPVNIDFAISGDDCDGDLEASFTNNSTGADSYRWIFTDSNGDTIFISTDDSFDYSFPAFGAYDITLEGTRNSDGCTARGIERVVIGNPDVVADFIIEIESCDSADFVRITDASFDPTGATVPVSWSWTVNGQMAGTDRSIIYDAEGEDQLDISLEVLFNSGCPADTMRSVDISELFPDVMFDYTLIQCSPNAYIVEFESSYTPANLNATSLLWTVRDGGITTTYTDDPLRIEITAEDTEITLDIAFDNECSDSRTEVLNQEDLLPELVIIDDFDPMQLECPEPGDSIDIRFSPGISGGALVAGIDAYLWTINGTNFNTEFVTIPVVEGDSLDISLVVTYGNGCVIQATRSYFAQFAPEPDVQVLSSCSGDSIEVFLSTVNTLGIDISEWSIDGVLVSSDSSLIFLLGPDGNLVELNVVYTNGCTQDYSMFFDPSLFRPEIEPDVDIISCDGDTADVQISIDPGIGLVNEDIIINGISYDSFPVMLRLSLNDTLSIRYFVEYENGCNDLYIDEREVRDYLPVPEFDVDLIECFENGIAISILDRTDSDIPFSTEYIITDGDSIYTLQDPVDSLFISSESIVVIQNVFFENGCMNSDTTTVQQSDILPELEEPDLEYDITPIECFGDSGVFMFTDLTQVPECLYIIEHLWVVNGDSCYGNPVIKTIPLGEDIPFSLSVTFNNGLVLSTATDTIANDTINSNDLVEQIDIEIGNNNAGFCNDSLDLFIINPDSSLNYEWALDEGFETIIGTGISIDTVGGPLFDGIVYVQTIDNFGDCKYGLDSLVIEFDTINLSYDQPFEICAGDTAVFEVINNNPDQTISYEWKSDGGQLISGGDTSTPVIGIPDNATDDFFLVLCTSNNFGCSAVDTIRFEIGTADTLQAFNYSIDSCGSLTVNFDAAPNPLGDDAHWDFGDGSTGDGAMISHTYGLPGTYLVTLSDSSDVCPSEPVSLEVMVGMLMVSIDADTIYYNPDTLVTLVAETNGNNEDVSWCLEDGTSIGTGNPLEGFDAMGDTVTLIVKINDSFGCSDQDTLVLIPEYDPEDCLDSLRITGPDREVVCIDEEVQLCVVLNEDCDTEDFSYLWNPDECILNGQGTPKVTVLASESKTIMVLVTHIESGIDSLYSFSLEVSNPNPMISIPDMNIDTNNLPFVCLGQDIELSVDPLDPNCNYSWSNGLSGSPIVISPEEDISLWVECVDEFGCVGVSDTIDIRVVPPRCDENDVFIPNAFSPNGDNVNDVLFVRSKFIDEMELVIVNRWGQEVFRTTDQSVGWDGTYKGEALGPDAFAYSLFVVCVDGQSYVKKGNVSIIR